MGRGKYDQYSKEFQDKALAFAEEIGGKQAAIRLGISPDLLWNWIKRKRDGGKLNRTDSPEKKAAILAAREIAKLKRENAELKQANLILRDVASDFFKDRLDASLSRSLKPMKKEKQK